MHYLCPMCMLCVCGSLYSTMCCACAFRASEFNMNPNSNSYTTERETRQKIATLATMPTTMTMAMDERWRAAGRMGDCTNWQQKFAVCILPTISSVILLHWRFAASANVNLVEKEKASEANIALSSSVYTPYNNYYVLPTVASCLSSE